ncbi:hypothetical protein [Vulcanisaeta sp. JCM 14467]|uniref:hypothetical protein n=1 Tax=Vulcanisaeta sp. JCM 14467 TaxID=1295370 RepID=UPI000AA99614|nr:hypothetical protein [Vulcanisaeta sp. JCM 14467]
MLTAVLGDGSADVKKQLKNNGRVYSMAVIKITMSGEEFERWESLFEKLKKIGFRSSKPYTEGNVVEVPFYGGNAINLARAMISVLPPILHDVLDALAFDKWVNLRRIAEMEMKYRRGEMQVNVAGYGFTVQVKVGTIVLEHRARDDDVDEVINALRARYGNEFTVSTHKGSRYRVVVIPARMIERYEDIKEQVIRILCRKLKKAKDEEKRRMITKHLKRLTPTKETATADYPEDPTQDRAQAIKQTY